MTTPDWTKPEQYAFVTKKKIKVEGVAWEFLRRNPEYGHDFAKVHDPNTPLAAKWPGKKVVMLDHPFGTKVGFPVPDMAETETQEDWVLRCKSQLNSLPTTMSASEYVQKKWQLAAPLLDPKCDALSLETPLKFQARYTPRILESLDDWDELKSLPHEDEYDDLPIIWDPDNVVVVFSVREAPTSQWKRIKDRLKAMHDDLTSAEQIQPTKTQQTAWIPALRVWDAEMSDCGLSKTMRATKIWPNYPSSHAVTKYDQALANAEKLILDKRYVDILQHLS